MVVTVADLIKKIILSFIFVSIAYQNLQARDLSVFSAFKELSLTGKDSTVRDYYINGGLNDGINIGALIDVYRRVPLHDPSTSKPVGDLQIPVARLRVIHADKGVSVARLHRVFNSKDKPLLDFKGVMVGDSITLFDGKDEGEKPEKAETKPEQKEKQEKVEAKIDIKVEPKPEPKVEPKAEKKIETKIQLKAGEGTEDLSSLR